MENIFEFYDKWGGLIPLTGGILCTIFSYKIWDPKTRDPKQNELWHKRFGPMMKIIGPLLILIGAFELVSSITQ